MWKRRDRIKHTQVIRCLINAAGDRTETKMKIQQGEKSSVTDVKCFMIRKEAKMIRKAKQKPIEGVVMYIIQLLHTSKERCEKDKMKNVII